MLHALGLLILALPAISGDLLALVNTFRSSHGKSPMLAEHRLARSAQHYADDILTIILHHRSDLLPYNLGSDQSTIQSRAERQGLRPPEALFFSETVSIETTNTSESFFRAMEHSPLACERLLSDHNRVGFGFSSIPCSKILGLKSFAAFNLLCSVNAHSSSAYILVMDMAYIPPPTSSACCSGTGALPPKVFILKPVCDSKALQPRPPTPPSAPRLVPVVSITTDTDSETGITRIYRGPTAVPVILPEGRNRLSIELQPDDLEFSD